MMTEESLLRFFSPLTVFGSYLKGRSSAKSVCLSEELESFLSGAYFKALHSGLSEEVKVDKVHQL